MLRLVLLGFWALTVHIEGFVPANSWAEGAVMISGSIAIVVLLAFVVLVVRNQSAVTTEETPTPITGAVQAVLAIFVWAIAATISAVAVVVAEPDRAFHEISTGAAAVAWQSVDTIPVLSIPDTLGWENPVSAAAGYVAWHMLLARAAFVVSVLAIGKAIYEQQVIAKQPKRATPSVQSTDAAETALKAFLERARESVEIEIEPSDAARRKQPKAANRSGLRKPK